MNILKNVSAVTYGIQTPLEAVNGVEPYTWSVISGGAGGSIDPDGLYTAPLVPIPGKTFDTIRVIDSAGVPVTAETVINVLTPVMMVCDIIRQGMGLQADQVIMYNQKYTVPNDGRLHISVGFLTGKPFSNTSVFEEVNGVMSTVQSINFSGVLDLDIMSRTTEAIERKEEMLMSLNSQYSKNMQGSNNFNIALIPTSFVNLNSEEGPAILYRFKASVAIQYLIKKVTAVSYYDTFQAPEITIDE